MRTFSVTKLPQVFFHWYGMFFCFIVFFDFAFSHGYNFVAVIIIMYFVAAMVKKHLYILTSMVQTITKQLFSLVALTQKLCFETQVKCFE